MWSNGANPLVSLVFRHPDFRSMKAAPGYYLTLFEGVAKTFRHHPNPIRGLNLCPNSLEQT